MPNTLRFMFLGDVVGQPGMVMFQKWIPKLKEKYKIDAVIVNGENSAKNGKGIIPKNAEFFKHNGASVITSGNHIWHHKEIFNYLNENDDLIRPANYPSGCPGKGYSIFEVRGKRVAVINLQGRGFMRDDLSCPFRCAESLLTFLRSKTNIIFIDFHAEASAEKKALAFYLDGKISGFYGTHTHVQTADERILPCGTSFITDLGYCGAVNSIIGMEQQAVVQKFLTQMMYRFVVEKRAPFELNGIWVEVDADSGKSLKIERISVIDEEQIDVL